MTFVESKLPESFADALASHVEAGNVRATRHPSFPLTIYNYTPQAQYTRAWDEVTLACRGLICDDEDNVVARPFTKFFNWSEWDEAIQDHYASQPHVITEKLDGSLGILYHWDGRWYVATRGSFSSDQAIHATKLLSTYRTSLIPPEGVTPLVEIIYPSNRIVVDYGDREELVLLSALSIPTGQRLASPWWDGPRVETLDLTLDDATTTLDDGSGFDTEGYVIAFPDGTMAKMKLTEYVRLHRILTGTNAVRIWEAMQDQATFSTLLDNVPDEFYTWVTNTATDLAIAYAEVETAANVLYEKHIHLAFESRKAFALEAVQTAYPDILFARLDGKDISPLIYKRIKPPPTVPFFRQEV